MRTLRHDVIRLEDIYSRALFDHSEERSRLVNFYFFFFERSVKRRKKGTSFNSRIVKNFDREELLYESFRLKF